MDWPTWWDWKLDCANPHLVKRMADRGFSEIDLREMLEQAMNHEPDHVEGRWLIRTTHEGRLWDVVVEPDEEEEVLVVVTAYRLEPKS